MTIIALALPPIACSRFSKCVTRSAAMSAMRSGSPTKASSAAHLLFSFSFFVSSSPSVISSNSASSFGSSVAFRLSLEPKNIRGVLQSRRKFAPIHPDVEARQPQPCGEFQRRVVAKGV